MQDASRSDFLLGVDDDFEERWVPVPRGPYRVGAWPKGLPARRLEHPSRSRTLETRPVDIHH
jgi:hypothetical protein